jgi:hypothetical protein
MQDDETGFQQVTRSKQSSMHRNRKGKEKQPVQKPLSSLLASKQQLLESSRYSQTCRGSEKPHCRSQKCLNRHVPSDLFKSLDVSRTKPDQCLRCICLGLGSLRDSPKSLLQLALLLEILPLFPVCIHHSPHVCFRFPDIPICLIFTQSIQFVVFADPAFTQEDLEYLNRLGYEAQLEDVRL